MSIESEMSHQRFRFLLQSGVWHLFSYFVIFVSCAACFDFQMHEYATMLFWQLGIVDRTWSVDWSCTFSFNFVFFYSFSPLIICPSCLPANYCSLQLFNQPSCALFPSVQHSNPGHAGPFPVASLHNANPTSPTSASMAGAHAHRSPASPIISPIELIPSVTNPENLPCLPDIPPIQVRIF